MEELQAQLQSMEGTKGWFERRLREAEVLCVCVCVCAWFHILHYNQHRVAFYFLFLFFLRIHHNQPDHLMSVLYFLSHDFKAKTFQNVLAADLFPVLVSSGSKEKSHVFVCVCENRR